MAPHRDETPHTSDSYEDENPFIVFRRFADQQISQIMQGLIGLPSAFSFHSAGERWAPYDEAIRRRVLEDLGLVSGQDNLTVPCCEGQVKAEKIGSSAARREQEVQEGYMDSQPLRSPPADYGSPFDMLPFPNVRKWHSLAPFQSYLLHSSYSPVYLETDPHLRKHGTLWREAFEDLIDVLNGNERKDNQLSQKQPSMLEWIAHVSGKTPPAFRSPIQLRPKMTNQLGPSAPEAMADDEDTTDLDLYECFLGFQSEAAENSSRDDRKCMVKSDCHGTQRQQKEQNKIRLRLGEQAQRTTYEPTADGSTQTDDFLVEGGIVSTLTKTQTITMPDGSTTTKLTLRKRFSDGTEESSETVHTTQASQGQQVTSAQEDTRFKAAETRQQEVSAKKGWFWS